MGSLLPRASPPKCFMHFFKTLTTINTTFPNLQFHQRTKPLYPFSTTTTTDSITPSKDLTALLIEKWHETVRHGSDQEYKTLTSRINKKSLKFTQEEAEKVLRKLSKSYTKSEREARQAHKFFIWASQHHNFTHTIPSHCIIINMLVASQLIPEAQPILISLHDNIREQLQKSENPRPKLTSDVIFPPMLETYYSMSSHPMLFDFVVKTYGSLGRAIEARNVLKKTIEDVGYVPKVSTWHSLCHSLSSSISWIIYEEMLMNRIYPDETMLEFMVRGICRKGEMQNVVDMIGNMQCRKSCSDSVMFVSSAFIWDVMKRGKVSRGKMLLKKLVMKSLIPPPVSYALLVLGHARVGDLEEALEVHQEMVERGFHPTAFTCTALIECYCSKGMLEEARAVLDTMDRDQLYPYAETFSLLIAAHFKQGELDFALRLFDRMILECCTPDAAVFRDVVAELCKLGRVSKADELLTALLYTRNIRPDEVIYRMLIAGYTNEENAYQVLRLFHEMEYREFEPSVVIFCLVLRCLCLKKRLDEAEMYLNKMVSRKLLPDALVYKTVSHALLQAGLPTEAMQVYCRMIKPVAAILFPKHDGFTRITGPTVITNSASAIPLAGRCPGSSAERHGATRPEAVGSLA